MCLTDVCSSPTGATFLFVLLLVVWQLADDNRWRALITSSQRKMNSYPASSRGVFTRRRGRQATGGSRRKNEALTDIYIFFLCRIFFCNHNSLSSLIHLPDMEHHTYAHTGRVFMSHTSFHFMGQKTRELIQSLFMTEHANLKIEGLDSRMVDIREKKKSLKMLGVAFLEVIHFTQSLSFQSFRL